MNEQNNIDRKLKIELELFKIFAIFVIAITTGFASVLYNIFDNTKNYNYTFLFVLLFISLIFLIFSFITLTKSYLKIKKIQKKC